MQLMKKFLPLLLISWVFAGCQGPKITNLTPSKLERNSAGLYPVEAAWETREHAFRPPSLKPQVMVGLQTFDMRPVPVVKDRFETMIPVPAGESRVRYRFKFDYEVNTIPIPRPDSKMSPEYTLEIVEKK